MLAGTRPKVLLHDVHSSRGAAGTRGACISLCYRIWGRPLRAGRSATGAVLGRVTKNTGCPQAPRGLDYCLTRCLQGTSVVWARSNLTPGPVVVVLTKLLDLLSAADPRQEVVAHVLRGLLVPRVQLCQHLHQERPCVHPITGRRT